jgi:SagB-type dehydrogenase family enzyme
VDNRDTDALRAYHEHTKHSPASIRRGPHGLDWEIMPRPFKVYPELAPIPLPRDFTTSSRAALAAIADPGTAAGDGPPLDRAALAHLLYFSAGVLHRRKYPGGELFFRAAANTGALYHIDVYLACAALPDLDAGVYHFGPHDFALRRLRAGDHRAVVVDAAAHEPAVTAAPVVAIFTSTFWRNAWKYRARAYRHCFWDLGTMLANLLAVAAGIRLPARVVLGFVDDAMNRLVDVDTEREVTLALVPLGRGASPPPAAPALTSLGLDTLPLSSREIDYPDIRRAHEASSLSSANKVETWRGIPPARPAEPPAGELVALAATPQVREPIETVILRRGSTREFARESIAFAELSAVLRGATRSFPADFAAPGTPLCELYLIAHAVDGLASGTYWFDRTRDGLVLLETGLFRREAGFLALGQALAADAAVDLFWLADLGAAFTRFGNRGYRAAQLEGGIEGGKAYLATYALRLGATGLTFFDDDVTAFFGPHAAGKGVMFLVALGHPLRRRGG